MTMAPIDKPLRVIVTLKNNGLLALRERLGLTQEKLGKLARVSALDISALENFGGSAARARPRSLTGKLSTSALRLARFFDVPVEQIAPPDLFEAIKVVRTERTLDRQEVAGLLTSLDECLALPAPDAPLEDPVMRRETARAVEDLLKHLTPREEQIVRLMYGLGEPPESLDDIAARFQVTRQRVRQIGWKAAGKLQRLITTRCDDVAARAVREALGWEAGDLEKVEVWNVRVRVAERGGMIVWLVRLMDGREFEIPRGVIDMELSSVRPGWESGRDFGEPGNLTLPRAIAREKGMMKLPAADGDGK